MLRIFTSEKIQLLRPGLNPQTWVPEASMLTTRPPKPSCSLLKLYVKFLITFDKYTKVINILTYNFRKELCSLPEDDLRIEACRSILSILV